MSPSWRALPLGEGLGAALRLLGWGAAVALVVIAASGVTVVKPDEVALRLRFGRLTGATRAEQVHGPGLLLSLPYLVDEVVRVPVRRVLEMDVDALRSRRALAFQQLDITEDGYALTGDQNVVQPAVRVKYQIGDPVRWALEIREPEALVHDAVVTALTRTLAEMPIDHVLVEGKRELAAAALRRAQASLDRAGPWVLLVALELTALQPPVQVARYFDDVQKAFVEKKTLEEKARRYAEQEVPRAEAERVGQINEARAYAADGAAAARGEAARFEGLLGEYRARPELVRQRLYLEAVEALMVRAGAVQLVPPGFERYHILVPGQTFRALRTGGRER
ncbi:MAG: protease modulator HflK [Planctomycetes bacterium]|nr:protease modulator HflK [Planctomycetota bacterium]